MELYIKRYELAKTLTRGRLFIVEEFECYVLEDPVREGPKVYGETAIPLGRYKITLEPAATLWSPQGKKLPKLHDVPGFADIYIHAGNTAKDTKGCPIVGRSWFEDSLAFSRIALTNLMKKMTYPCYVTVEEV